MKIGENELRFIANIEDFSLIDFVTYKGKRAYFDGENAWKQGIDYLFSSYKKIIEDEYSQCFPDEYPKLISPPWERDWDEFWKNPKKLYETDGYKNSNVEIRRWLNHLKLTRDDFEQTMLKEGFVFFHDFRGIRKDFVLTKRTYI